MEKNATINSRLEDLLNVMDARAYINVLVEDYGTISVAYRRVYEFISDPELMHNFGNCKVIGVSCGLATNILIEEA